MPIRKLLVANRGEVAARILRTAAEVGITTVAVHARGDDDHVRFADAGVALDGEGPSPYLDGPGLIALARNEGCDGIHPGYGFLSERPEFVSACEQAQLVFVGPSADTMARLGDKLAARQLAREHGVPRVEGSGPLPDGEAARAFAEDVGGPVILKSTAGGGGRGLRVAAELEAVAPAFAACQAEVRAEGASVYAERLVRPARHVEVQVLGDGARALSLGTRDCTLQRRRQKIVELAPAPKLALGPTLEAWAVRLAEAVGFRGLATFEFLVQGEQAFFMECNPRLQVEHTVTEMVTGLDLVALQLEVAGGASLDQLPLPAPTRGWALQIRINAERVGPSGEVLPTEGQLSAAQWPAGPGVRVDTALRRGSVVSGRFDPLIAKVVVHVSQGSQDALRQLLAKARRAVGELQLDGLDINRDAVLQLLEHGAVGEWEVDLDLGDTLWRARALTAGPRAPLASPLRAEVVQVLVEPGEVVHEGQELVVLEALKMHHVVSAPHRGEVTKVYASVGEVVQTGFRLVELREVEGSPRHAAEGSTVDLETPRRDLAALLKRVDMTLDDARPEAVARRHASGGRTARENVEAICDPGSFREHGQLALAAQRRFRSMEELVAKSPADGIVAGFGTVNAEQYGSSQTRCAVLAYDYTVMAGTQGYFGHKKTDRVLELARRAELPAIIFCEGGGGRPNDVDFQDVVASTLDVGTFAGWASLRGPRIAVAHGPCFAGNAVLFGCSDVTIATERAFVGMAGPAMVEAGGLGACRVEDIGPISIQRANGVVDLVVANEAEAAEAARRVLAYLQGPVTEWSCADQRSLRVAIPEDRKRVYDVRPILGTLFDSGSLLELRRDVGVGMIVGLARIEGRPLGFFANDPRHLGGAIDAEGTDQAAWIMSLCERFGLPLLSLCDTPGFMVGPEYERAGTVRRAGQMLNVAAQLTVPLVTVCLRKGYGLGAQAMAGGSFWQPARMLSWPGGEFGPMGLEGAVQLGFRRQLEAESDPVARQKRFDEEVAKLYDLGKALSTAAAVEIDAVIDPALTRAEVLAAFDGFDGKGRGRG